MNLTWDIRGWRFCGHRVCALVSGWRTNHTGFCDPSSIRPAPFVISPPVRALFAQCHGSRIRHPISISAYAMCRQCIAQVSLPWHAPEEKHADTYAAAVHAWESSTCSSQSLTCVPPQYIRDMWNEHNLVLDAEVFFMAYNAGNKITTTPMREVVFFFLHSTNPPPITFKRAVISV